MMSWILDLQKSIDYIDIYVKVETGCGYNFTDEQESVHKKIVGEWLPNLEYILSNAPEVTIIHKYHDENDKKDSYAEIFIPIEKGKQNKESAYMLTLLIY